MSTTDAFDLVLLAVDDAESAHAARLARELTGEVRRVSVLTAPAVMVEPAPGPVVVHAFSAAGAGRPVPAGPGAVTVVHDHRGDDGPPCPTADHVVVGSHAEATAVVAAGFARGSVSIVARPVDERYWAADGPAADRGDAIRLVATTGLRPGDGTDTAVAALARVPDVELVVTGPVDSPAPAHRAELGRLLDGAAALGVAGRVRFVSGPTPEVIRSADVVLHLPWSAAPVDPVLHAMACGVPVIAGATGGLPETVVDDLTGVLVPPRDPRATARAIRRLCQDKTRLAAFSVAAVDRVAQRHSWTRVAGELLRVYREAAGLAA
ncbi:hypothetical protein GCM10022243_43590 [Saccharothrix violaceirubra]|uniref:Glycosyltransferase involved in cell wall biosynthesis n=1 Tax=Saccharothrix violaceirubra TaxID=413306 RepID=A0A7W7T320_9PSEU|nr:glycosyltransferase family 4 protein [Saccharothrix violaceirubra]MBB4965648.1 glycosyltransferase involved in cell wall biosynthesis [Saccharothrix violaceirubra]